MPDCVMVVCKVRRALREKVHMEKRSQEVWQKNTYAPARGDEKKEKETSFLVEEGRGDRRKEKGLGMIKDPRKGKEGRVSKTFSSPLKRVIFFRKARRHSNETCSKERVVQGLTRTGGALEKSLRLKKGRVFALGPARKDRMLDQGSGV